MPYKPAWPCIVPGCLNVTTSKTRHCDKHAYLYKPYERPMQAISRASAAARGYNHAWKKIREGVLRGAGIPRGEWPLYDVHHTPDYDAAIEPDHRKYTLTPKLHADHSGETLRNINKKRKGRGV
jgi:hypothetical protein